MTDGYRHQLSITGAGWMYNARADNDQDFEELLESAGSLAPAITETAGLLLAAGTLAVAGVTGQQVPAQRQAPTQEAAGGAPGPSCVHGARVFAEGTSKASGKPWRAWKCPLDKGSNSQGKCDIQWA